MVDSLPPEARDAAQCHLAMVPNLTLDDAILAVHVEWDTRG